MVQIKREREVQFCKENIPSLKNEKEERKRVGNTSDIYIKSVRLFNIKGHFLS